MLLLIQPAVVWIVVEIVTTQLPTDFRRLIWSNQQSPDPVTQEQRSTTERDAMRSLRNRFYLIFFQLLLAANISVMFCIWLINVQLLGFATTTIAIYLLFAVAGVLFYRLRHEHQRVLGAYLVEAIKRNSQYQERPLSEEGVRELHNEYIPTRFRHGHSLGRFLGALGVVLLLHVLLATYTNVLVFIQSDGPSSIAGGVKITRSAFDFDESDGGFDLNSPGTTPRRKKLHIGRQLWYPAPDSPPSVIELYVEDQSTPAIGYGIERETYWGTQVNGHYVYRWFDRDSVVIFYEGNGTTVFRISRETAQWISSVLRNPNSGVDAHEEVFATVGIESKLLKKL